MIQAVIEKCFVADRGASRVVWFLVHILVLALTLVLVLLRCTWRFERWLAASMPLPGYLLVPRVIVKGL